MSGSSTSLPDKLNFLEEEGQLCEFLGSDDHTDKVVTTHLQASDRVIARVTDGIYREPASALRELISNAWDADAKNITILTDAPRFERIYVRDDGNGMTYQTLAHLVKNIGGSAKRHEKGQELGVTGANDNDLSPGGRLLIGKVGIGLFSVSQLARRFRIVTKVEGAAYRLVAEVELRAYTEDGDEDDHVEAEASDKYISGVVRIIRQQALDLSSHGTDLILEDIKPRVRDLLRDRDRWTAILSASSASIDAKGSAPSIAIKKPIYHSGYALLGKKGETTTLIEPANLPWDSNSEPGERMSMLMSAVERESRKTDRPNLADTLDAYLGMLWTLGLSAPVKYVDGHPFDLKENQNLGLYWISNEQKGQASEVQMHSGETVREAIRRAVNGHPSLSDGASGNNTFSVFVDDVEIKRPIRFNFVAAGEKNIQKSLLFVGKYSPDLTKISPEKRGGSLEMEGYIFWNGRIIPKENNGVLIRIRGASGAVFDSTFFKYQVSELTRLRQLTSEIYIQRGLDAALNIDRESFNFSHPHVQLVALWLQRGIRQLTNKHKDLAAAQRKGRLRESVAAANSDVVSFVEKIWLARQLDDELPDIRIGNQDLVEDVRRGGSLAFDSARIFSTKSLLKIHQEEREAKARAIMQVLLAFNLIQDMPFQDQEDLVNALLQVFYGVEQQ